MYNTLKNPFAAQTHAARVTELISFDRETRHVFS